MIRPNSKRQFQFTFQSGNFRNIYFHVGFDYDLALRSAREEFKRDCLSKGFTPLTASLIFSKEVPIVWQEA